MGENIITSSVTDPASGSPRPPLLMSMPSLSIVMEWENAKNSDVQRGFATLSALAQQVRALRNASSVPPELLLIHDEAAVSGQSMRERLESAAAGFPGAVRIFSTRGLDYYQQKNFGAQKAVNDVVLFVDCDVVLTADWLERLLKCYVEEGADVVCGATHMEQRSVYEKSFAAFWFFPLASELGGRQRTSAFFANNVLFRSAVIKSLPFPDAPLVRGKCVLLSDQLRQRQYSMFIEPAASVLHPPPDGFLHFVKRALCAGHDNLAMTDHRGLRHSFWRFRAQLRAAISRIRLHRKEVGLSRGASVLAYATAGAYIGLAFLGEAISLYRSDWIYKYFRV
ncbi:MAG: glycosyltransferase family 2 protein [Pseudomonadota bacterium]|nr:glycosyltransferase family 2 protein [Pseudomonadota bacterium]